MSAMGENIVAGEGEMVNRIRPVFPLFANIVRMGRLPA